MAFDDYVQYDGLGLAELVQRGEVTPLELVETAIARIEACNPKLNAVVTKLYDRARAAAQADLPDGPFKGVPFLMKDLLSTLEGVPTSMGNRLWKDIPARVDGELARRWQKTGAIVLGKTNTPEFGLTPYTEPEAFGPTHNPWDLSRTPGGSSGGSAAAVAARLVPFASGGDGGGSIRIPSSACGVFGLKPTRGRMPTGPQDGEYWDGLAVEHILTRSVRDSAAMLDATQGADWGAPCRIPDGGPYLQATQRPPQKLKIAFTTQPFLGEKVHADCVQGVAETVRLLQELGHTVEEAAPPIDREPFALAFLTVLGAHVRADMEEAAAAAGRKLSPSDFDAVTMGAGLMGIHFTAAGYVRAMRYLRQEARRVARFFLDYDVLLTPTLSEPPVKIGALQPDAAQQVAIRWMTRTGMTWLLDATGMVQDIANETFSFLPWTPIFNVTGQPAMSVPLHWNADGLPIGMHFVGRWGDEATLFALAAQLEAAHPWRDKQPSVC